MGLTIDKQAATAKFSRALVIAHASTPLPEEWLERARRVGAAKSKTFTPMLGTALLAKATDRFVDALSLREGESHKSYSARSLAKEVLVPCCQRAGIDLRNKGMEPLNNQPFLRAERVSTQLNVKSNARADLEYLVECLTRADFLEDSSALDALAAFLRVGLERSERRTPVTLGPGMLSLPDLSKSLDEFVAGDSEGGKVGQAIVTAILDLVFPEVRTKAINDPSHTWPGDVGVFDDGSQTLAVEVKQRPMRDTEVIGFVARLRDAKIHRGGVVSLAQGGEALDLEELQHQAHRLHGVSLVFYMKASDLLQRAVEFADRGLHASLLAFPGLAIRRMEQLEVSVARMAQWADLFAVADAAPATLA